MKIERREQRRTESVPLREHLLRRDFKFALFTCRINKISSTQVLARGHGIIRQ